MVWLYNLPRFSSVTLALNCTKWTFYHWFRSRVEILIWASWYLLSYCSNFVSSINGPFASRNCCCDQKPFPITFMVLKGSQHFLWRYTVLRIMSNLTVVSHEYLLFTHFYRRHWNSPRFVNMLHKFKVISPATLLAFMSFFKVVNHYFDLQTSCT